MRPRVSIYAPSITIAPTHTEEACTVKATLHGSAVNADYPSLKAHFCSNSNIYVFVVHDHKYYKMTAVTLQQAQTSTAPASADKFIEATKGSIDATDHTTVCNMWEGKGYDTKSGSGAGYKLKDVQVSCGSCIYV